MKFIIIAVLATALTGSAAQAVDLCDVPGKRDEFYRSIKPLGVLLSERKLGELDARLNEMLAAHAKGRMRDETVNRVFLEYFAKRDVSLEPLLREWVAKFPKSQAARFALGMHLTSQGWAARGGKFAKDTSRRQFAGMESYFRESLKLFDEADALGTKPTLSIAQRISLSPTTPALGLDGRRLYREAIKKYPDTLQVRVAYLEISDPKWGGSIRQIESIIEDAKAMPEPDRRYIEYLAYRTLAGVYWCSEGEGCGDGAKRNGEHAKQVVEYYEKSIPLCPGFDDSLWGLMRYYEERKDNPGLIGAASRMIERHPRHANAFYMRGEAYGNSGKMKEAFADIQRATELGHAYAFRELAWFYESGTVVPRDVRKAIDLYMIADSRKIEGARREAERLSKASGIPLK